MGGGWVGWGGRASGGTQTGGHRQYAGEIIGWVDIALIPLIMLVLVGIVFLIMLGNQTQGTSFQHRGRPELLARAVATRAPATPFPSGPECYSEPVASEKGSILIESAATRIPAAPTAATGLPPRRPGMPPPGMPPPGQPPGGTRRRRHRRGYQPQQAVTAAPGIPGSAVVSLVLGIVGIVLTCTCLGVILGPISIVLGSARGLRSRHPTGPERRRHRHRGPDLRDRSASAGRPLAALRRLHRRRSRERHRQLQHPEQQRHRPCPRRLSPITM